MSAVAIFLVLILILASYIIIKPNEPDEKFITAFEAKEIADNVTHELGIDLPLTTISAKAINVYEHEPGRLDSNGKSTLWQFHYQQTNDTSFNYTWCSLLIYSNGSHYIDWMNGTGAYWYVNDLVNLNIDSDRAYEQAVSNNKIKTFLSEHPGVKMISFDLSWDFDHNCPIWNMDWQVVYPFDNISGIHARISADTGQWIMSP